jgi:hypothetical protein
VLLVYWNEGRFKFKDSGTEIPELWKQQQHLELFRAPGGTFACAEVKMKETADKDGDGTIDWDEVRNSWADINSWSYQYGAILTNTIVLSLPHMLPHMN